MKFLKFGIFALSMGLFVASCGDNANNEGEATEPTTEIETTEVIEPVPAPEAAPVADSVVAPEAQ